MTDQDRVRWTKLVADYEASELTQREFAITSQLVRSCPSGGPTPGHEAP
jgi:hypothetical protein